VRRFVTFAFLALALSAPSPAAVYHVRPGGSDEACDGKVDADHETADASRRCAWRHPGHGATRLRAGDTLRIHAGRYPAFDIPHLRADADRPTIIEGDPNDAVEDVIVDADGGDWTIRSVGGRSTSTPTENLVLRNLRLVAGTRAAVRLEQNHRAVLLEGLLALPEDLGSLRGRMGSPRTAFIWSGGSHLGNDLEVRGVQVTGHRSVCLPLRGSGPICGTDSGFIFNNGHGARIHDNTVKNLLGGFYNESGNDTIIEENTLENSACDADDGCIQVYNDRRTIVRRNLFVHVTPVDGRGLVRLRRSNSGKQPPSAAVYNNTFIGNPEFPFGSLRRNGLVVAPPSAPSSYDEFVAVNNVFLNYANEAAGADSAAILIQKCPDRLLVRNNAFWNISGDKRVSVTDAVCRESGTDHPEVTADPMLEDGYEPRSSSPLCGAGTSFTAWDGDEADSWIGARRGACSSGDR